MPKVTFLNEGRVVEAKPGQTILQVAQEHGIDVFRGLFRGFHCRRRFGWCGRCKVWVNGGAEALTPRTAKEAKRLRGDDGGLPQSTLRLACQVTPLGDCEVRTRAGFDLPLSDLRWEADPRPWKWRDRWERRNDEPSEEEGAKKKGPAKAAEGAAAKAKAAPAKAAVEGAAEGQAPKAEPKAVEPPKAAAAEAATPTAPPAPDRPATPEAT